MLLKRFDINWYKRQVAVAEAYSNQDVTKKGSQVFYDNAVYLQNDTADAYKLMSTSTLTTPTKSSTTMLYTC